MLRILKSNFPVTLVFTSTSFGSTSFATRFFAPLRAADAVTSAAGLITRSGETPHCQYNHHELKKGNKDKHPEELI
jgi:hypothetical protein